ncbi:MAG: methyltransferase domain-containing protein [Clostridia bacterium]|nr:methyltransferase domain-containing protein [Clostridia bacterium]
MDLKKRAEEMRTFFDRKTDGYDEVHAKFAGTKRLLTEGLPDGIRNVLDLGAGTGLELFPLFERFPEARVTVIDISEGMLSALAKRPFADRLTVVCGDFFETDFGGPYDAAISTSALHHFAPQEKQKLYERIHACLAPGGIFLNSDKIVFDRNEERDTLASYFRDPAQYPHMDTPLAPSTEMELLENAGFGKITVALTDREDYRLYAAVRD